MQTFKKKFANGLLKYKNGDEERKAIKSFLRNTTACCLDVMESKNAVLSMKNLGHNIFCCAKMTNGSSEAEESSTVFAIIVPHFPMHHLFGEIA